MIPNIKKIAAAASTNSVLKKNQLAEEGDVIFADNQTAGRGLGEHTWESAPGMNITASILLKPAFLEPQAAFTVSMAVSVGIINYLEQFTPKTAIKWPNDIYIKNRKQAGLLIENEFTENSVLRTIAGIGFNVNQKYFYTAPNPVSLSQITGREHDIGKTAEQLFASVLDVYEVLKQNPAKVIGMYHQNLYGHHKWLTCKDAHGMFRGQIKQVAEDGKINIKDEHGDIREYYFKEVQFAE